MINVTNDAWYGQSSAAWQHMMMYAVRAVESGRSVARSANTGISGWVDSRGRVHQPSGMYTTEYVLADVRIESGTTPYVQLGEWVAVPALIVALFLWFTTHVGAGFWRRRREWPEAVFGYGAMTVFFGGVLVWFVRGHPTEDVATKMTALWIMSLLVGLGNLSGRPWGRTATRWVGRILVVGGSLGVLAGAFWAAGIAVLGVVLAETARRRAHAFQRGPAYEEPVDP